MFTPDVHFLLTLHHQHVADLRAEADADRLARSVPGRSGRDPARRSWRGRRAAGAGSRSPALR